VIENILLTILFYLNIYCYWIFKINFDLFYEIFVRAAMQ